MGWADRVFWAGLSLLMAMAARLIHLVLYCPCEQFARSAPTIAILPEPVLWPNCPLLL